MYHPGRTQTNTTFASMQRSFYPKHVSYYGNGTGRDGQITQNGGGLLKPIKSGMGHQGVHLQKYNSNVSQRNSPSPRKDASTFYYQSDGSGRDGYVLKNNGGLRMEYNVRNSGDNIFRGSLRSDQKSPLKYFQDPRTNQSDITTYLNWKSHNGNVQNQKHLRIQKDVTRRLTTGSPSREHTIKYIIGQGEVGRVKKQQVPSFQGYNTTYKQLLSEQKVKGGPLIPAYGSLAMRGKDVQKRFGSTIQNFRPEDMSRNQGQIDKVNPNTEEPKDIARKKQAKSAMRSNTVALSSQLQGSRDDMIKTSWQQKRNKLREGAYNPSTTMNNFNQRNQSIQDDQAATGAFMDRKKSYDIQGARNSTLSGTKDRAVLNPYKDFAKTEVKQSLEDIMVKQPKLKSELRFVEKRIKKIDHIDGPEQIKSTHDDSN